MRLNKRILPVELVLVIISAATLLVIWLMTDVWKIPVQLKIKTAGVYVEFAEKWRLEEDINIRNFRIENFDRVNSNIFSLDNTHTKIEVKSELSVIKDIQFDKESISTLRILRTNNVMVNLKKSNLSGLVWVEDGFVVTDTGDFQINNSSIYFSTIPDQGLPELRNINFFINYNDSILLRKIKPAEINYWKSETLSSNKYITSIISGSMKIGSMSYYIESGDSLFHAFDDYSKFEINVKPNSIEINLNAELSKVFLKRGELTKNLKPLRLAYWQSEKPLIFYLAITIIGILTILSTIKSLFDLTISLDPPTLNEEETRARE